MNQKKCPKCGEMNPGEAVMCWACYTPLSGGGAGATVATATAGAAPAALATGVATHEEKEKAAIPPWQIAVIVIGLLVGIGFGVMSFMGGAPADVPVDPNTEVPMPGDGPIPDPNAGGNVTPPTSNNEIQGGSYTSIPPKPLPYTMVTPPNPTSDWGVAAIVPTGQNLSPSNAARLAAFARETFKGGRNRAFQIFVFADAQTAQIFNEYQAKRRGQVLQTSDYMALSQIWPRCLACVEFNGGRQTVKYPSKTPAGWWNQR